MDLKNYSILELYNSNAFDLKQTSYKVFLKKLIFLD